MKLLPAAAGALALAGLLLAERRWPLRPRAGDTARLRTNAALGALAAATSVLVEAPLVALTKRAVARRRWALSHLPPGPLRTLLALAWLDYTLYLWHRAAHRQPLLWRLHLPHHLDPALDVSTAWRFHALELAASAPLRALQVGLLGVPEDALSLWQRLLLASICFHHSNLRLPERLDRALGRVIMTPRLHGIHHSARAAQRDSNWSSGLTLWDALHGTLRRDATGADVPIGVEGVAPAVGLGAALWTPFIEPVSASTPTKGSA